MDLTAFHQALDTYLRQQMPNYTLQLMELVSIPSISSSPAHGRDMTRILENMRDIVTRYGFRARIVRTPGHPAFIATLETAADRPWVVIYNHMDVQPAQEPQWNTDPFIPVLKNEAIYGRGSTDDKGPALAIIHAINFLRTQNLPMPNIQIVYETEEEIGSPHFGAFLDEHGDALQAPASILVSDTIFEGDHPAITYQLRGMQRLEIELKTGSKDLHSGLFGGVARNPLNDLLHALSRCVSDDGQLTVPSLLEDVWPLSPEEQQELDKVAEIFSLSKFDQDSEQAARYSDDARDILMRTWHRPTFEVHGFEGIQSTPGMIKSALPYQVKAKVTMRLVPGLEPANVVHKLQAFLRQIDPGIQVIDRGGSRPVVTALDNPFMEKAREACTFGFEREPVFVGSGGSIGALPEFQRVFPQAPIVLIAQSLMSDGYHAPNEHFRLEQARRGIKTIAHYLTSIADFRG
jgi:acetylornithine deacetylase/succinyl-diaminopimelate desuccinylase-like protein